MKEKYLNEAIIGNKNMLTTFTSNGEIQRMYFPSKDIKQYIKYFHTGVKVNQSDLIYLHDDVNNEYKQYYDTDTNILNTEIVNTYFNLKILQTDYIMNKENVLVRKYTFVNDSKIDLDLEFFVHSATLTDTNNFVSCKMIKNGMIQYAHDQTVSTIAKGYILSQSKIHGAKETIKRCELIDKDYIGMSSDSAISYKIGNIKPNEKRVLELLVIIGDNGNISDVEGEIDRISKIDMLKEYNSVKAYWRKYLKTHDTLNIDPEKSKYEEKIYEIYKRSILLFPLLSNQETGGMIAAPEIDEDFTKCGRYAYCWPRDAVFIAKAMDILGMEKETEKFYKTFCKKTQSKNGMWEQRFYTNGKLAPCWGYQIDETASVIYGIYEHFKYTNSEKFLKENLQMCEKAINFLIKYVQDWLKIELPGKKDIVKEELDRMYNPNNEHRIPISYDLWEMNEGIHLYSLASIYAAFINMINIYDKLSEKNTEITNRLKEEKINKTKTNLKYLSEEIKKYIKENLLDKSKNVYFRNIEDRKMDISILGAVTPFNVFDSNEKEIRNTIENINLTLRTYTGGYKRFEYDHYMNGNPWPIANMWMTLYYLKQNDIPKAKETFDFVINSSGKHDFLGEQVSNDTMKPNWVIGLGWSHAMFIIVLEELYGKKVK